MICKLINHSYDKGKTGQLQFNGWNAASEMECRWTGDYFDRPTRKADTSCYVIGHALLVSYEVKMSLLLCGI